MIEKQSIPQAIIINKDSKNNSVNDIKSMKKMSLVSFKVDESRSNVNSTKLGSKDIIIREDIVENLTKIKQSLNDYGIPLSCNFINISLTDDNLSQIAKLGLEINLNTDSGLNTKSNLNSDDYYIGPDYSRPYGNGYMLKVYAAVKRKQYDRNLKYKQIDHPIDVYDIKETYGFYPPKIKKIFKPIIDLTSVFHDNGFKMPPPNKEFFYKSDNIKSNWFVFQNTNKINVGDTYTESLSKIYENRDEPIWNEKELIWDGEKFS